MLLLIDLHIKLTMCLWNFKVDTKPEFSNYGIQVILKIGYVAFHVSLLNKIIHEVFYNE